MAAAAATAETQLPRMSSRELGLQVAQGREGIVISHIASGSAAEQGGLQVGDVILGVDGHDFSSGTSSDSANSVLNAASDNIMIRACRNGGTLNPIVLTTNSQAVGDARLSQLVKLMSNRTTTGVAPLHSEFGGVSGLARALHTDLERGLPSKEAIERSQHLYGKNSVPEPRSASLLELMWDALHDTTIIILIIAAVVSLILGVTVGDHKDTGYIEGVAILVAIIVVVMVTAVNDKQKENQFKQLQKKQNEEKLISVIRNGEQMRINVVDLVVGDLALLATGAIMPADGILIRGSDLSCDESALTGESKDINKGPENPFILSGSSVKVGSGYMLVTCVGLFSEEGIIRKLITGVGKKESLELEQREAEMYHVQVSIHPDDEDALLQKKEEQDKREKEKPSSRKKESVLQAKLDKMAMQIGYIGTFVAVLTVLVLFARYFIETYGIDGKPYQSSMWVNLLSFLVVGITVLVVAIPEGLPLAVTISLAFSVKKMMDDHNLVRVLASCETMGNATTICSDKTGTLTKNKMTVIRAWMCGKDYQDLGKIVPEVAESVRTRLSQHIAFNSSPEAKYRISDKDNLPIQEGNKTECALLHFSDQIVERKFGDIRADVPNASLKMFPFDSAKKRMTTGMPLPGGGSRIFVKGAAEIVLNYCVSYDKSDGSVAPLTEELNAELRNVVINAYADRALRVILLAYKDLPGGPGEVEDDLVNNLTISAFVGIMDPVRDEVPDAVLSCQAAGVVVRMVTGDNMMTARAIAFDCNILHRDQRLEQYTVMEGPTFRSMVVNADGTLNFVVMQKICEQLRVMGRCSPTDKYHLVQGLRHFGQIVAVTGDGTNDGPALSEADVGFAMGIAGTGVAKEASDIIITDDNFSSIVKAISWGRNVYDAICKFLVFQLTVNVAAIVVAFIGACILKESPLRAVQLLWVNLIMDSFASLALATEPPTPELLTRRPYQRSQPLISAIMLRQILGHAIYQLIICFILTFAGDTIFDIPSGRQKDINDPPSQHYTIIFNAFVFLQLFNEINARKINGEFNVFEGIFDNPIFVIVWVLTVGGQGLIVEFGGRAFRTTGLTGAQWGICIAIGATSLIANVFIRFLFPPTLFPARWFAPKPVAAPAEIAAASGDMAMVDVAQAQPVEPLPRLESHPLATAGRFHRGRAAAEMWSKGMSRLRTHLMVVAAFRDAGRRSRRQTIRDVTEDEAQERMAQKAAERRLPPTVLEVAGEAGGAASRAGVPPRKGMWKVALTRIRRQLQVIGAFRDSLIRRISRPSDPSLSLGFSRGGSLVTGMTAAEEPATRPSDSSTAGAGQTIKLLLPEGEDAEV